MSQVSDYNIANASGASVRSDLNAVFDAIKTLNSGGTDPANPEAFMPYVDTADSNNLKIRNAANNGFTTVDINGANISWDLKNGIPLKDNSVDLIYSSHLLEHIAFKELILFLKECKRILKNNGVFSVCVPNAGNYLNAYFKGETFENNYYPPALIETGSKIDQINYMAYMDGTHKYLFDEENLINTLLTAGFKYAQLRKFDPNLDSKGRDYESIYAIAKKN